jgi:thioester reductase-like protein
MPRGVDDTLATAGEQLRIGVRTIRHNASPGNARGGRRRPDGLLLTGATGFVGMEVLARYLERTSRPIYLLVRAADDRAAAARVADTLTSLFGRDHSYAERVVPVRGDITHQGLGLRREQDRLAEQVTEVVHAAASISFELGLQESREINVEGTRRVVEFAERCHERGGLRRLSYVSTAYVAGEHAGRFNEDDLDVGQRFRNAYEQSKFEAESLVASRRARLPITVLRPSIVVGESDSGWTTSFNVVYWPLRAFSRGAYLALPARREAPVDVVPVDYVADAIFALSQAASAAGGTYHLTAGASASSVGELVELAARRFKRPAPMLIRPAVYRRVIHPLLLRASRDRRRRQALRRSEVFFPYFAAAVTYDDRRTRTALAGAGIEPTPLAGYFDRLVEFALDADWGRRQIPRASVAAGDLRPHRGRGARVPSARGRPGRAMLSGSRGDGRGER